MEAHALITLSGLWKWYDDIVAVRDFELEVAPGTTMGIIGPNGSGKTTLLRMVSTLVKPDRGSLQVCGHDACAAPREVRRRVSFMPAETAAPLDMSIGEYMAYFACAAGVPRRQRRQQVGEALALTDLTGREHLQVRGLSTGNRQRLLLAKTLLGDPDLLVLDEPASGLDPRARIEIREFLRELAGMGKTVVISSHILADIESICTDICILEAGRRRLAGSLAELRRRFGNAQRMVLIRVPPAALSGAAAALAGHPAVLECAVEKEVLRIASSEENCNAILQTLIAQGFEIQELREETADLEDIFMLSTQGVVS